jgi:malonyl-CoA O-methyltransferase
MLPSRNPFADAAATYHEAALLARETGRRMAQRLDYVKLVPTRFADIGCASGDGLRLLQQRYPQAQPLAIDLSREMLLDVRQRMPLVQRLMQFGHLGRLDRGMPQLVNADALALPLAAGSLDLIWSNLMLHWLDEPLPALCEMQRALRTDGLLMFSMLGPDTLKELRLACQSCGIEPPLRQFLDMHDVGDMLVAAGFSDPVMDMEMITMSYGHAQGVRGLLRDQRHLGVRNALFGQMPWAQWRRVLRAYAGRHADDVALPVSFEIVYGHAWKAAPRMTDDGRAIIRFEKRAGRH